MFYRDTCQREAVRRGVAGWARNLPDGTVEAVFEGPEARVDEMVDWCGVGPPSAQVSGVDVVDEQAQGDGEFRILP